MIILKRKIFFRKNIWLILSLVIAGLLTSFHGATSLSAQGITVTPWQMNNGGGNFPIQLNGHGDAKAYSLATIPAETAEWRLAPLNNGKLLVSETSKIPGNMCYKAVDFTYFQAFVDIPAAVNLTRFRVTFTYVDDGARIYIFNSKNPNGGFIEGADMKFNGAQQTTDLSSLVAVGEVNRVIIVQFDDCCCGNRIDNALIEVNGNPIPTAPPEIEVTPEYGTTCVGSQDGAASVSALGGGYTYLWESGETTSSAYQLSGGVQNVIVTDSLGNTKTLEFTIAEPPPFTVEAALISEGSYFALIEGGTPPYQYGWDEEIGEESIGNLLPGQHFLVVLDSIGCDAEIFFTVPEPVIVDSIPPPPPPPAPADCMKQVNVDPVWSTTETVLLIPEQRVQVTPPTYDTVTQTVIVKEAATRKYFSCDASGAISICSEDIPAVTETYTYKIMVNPGTFTTTPAKVIKYAKSIKVKDGYIGYVPCGN